MPDIYDQHKAAFPSVSAYVVLHNGERVATIAFKHPRDGSGRLYAYVHWLGVEMVRGFAGGYGYDKHSAACADAAQRAISEGNTGILAVPGKRLADWLGRLSNSNAQGEYYLTDVIAMAVADGLVVATEQASSASSNSCCTCCRV